MSCPFPAPLPDGPLYEAIVRLETDFEDDARTFCEVALLQDGLMRHFHGRGTAITHRPLGFTEALPDVVVLAETATRTYQVSRDRGLSPAGMGILCFAAVAKTEAGVTAQRSINSHRSLVWIADRCMPGSRLMFTGYADHFGQKLPQYVRVPLSREHDESHRQKKMKKVSKLVKFTLHLTEE